MDKRDIKIYSSEDIIEKENVGNKAYFLFALADVSRIPPLICLDADMFINIISEESNRKLKNQILMAFANKLGLISELETIKEGIMNMYIPNSIREAVNEMLTRQKIREPYAVRSSSLLEDNAHKSGAGVYESFTNVKKEEIFESVKKCWAAQFSVRSLSYNSDICSLEQFRIGVIIQQYQTAVKSGVLFSVDPVCPADGMRIEMVDGNCERFMQGEIGANRVIHCIVNHDDYAISDNECGEWVKELFQVCNFLRKKLGYEIDVEWAFDGNKVYILQCRPITTVVEEIPNEWLKNILDINDIPTDEMGAISWNINKFKEKNVLYKFCNDLDVPILGWHILRYSKSSDVKKYVEQIVKHSGKGNYSIMMNKLLMDFQCNFDELEKMLYYIIDMARTEYITVSIKFIPHNEYSLISYYDSVNKKVRVECVPGIMKGLKSGYLNPTTFIANAEGKIIEQKKVKYTYYYEIDLKTDIFYTVDCNMELTGLEQHIERIAKYTVALYEKFVSGVLEWWICGDKVYVTDYSLESGNIDNEKNSEMQEADRTYLSKGTVRGRVVKISEQMIKELDDFSYSCAVSVNVYDESVKEIDIIRKVEDYLLAEKKKYGAIILAAEHPYLSLLPFLYLVDGLVFKGASMLCHLSVIIREKAIPTVCVGNEYDSISNGCEYEI